ncbi:MAG: hypothetical protein Q8O83_01550 [bacterium]|nr:hypothetical protein [bacterium]
MSKLNTEGAKNESADEVLVYAAKGGIASRGSIDRFLVRVRAYIPINEVP